MSELDLRQELINCADSDGDISIDELPESFEVVDAGEWTQDCKYQVHNAIVKHKETSRLFAIWRSRIGSYHSDWCYEASDVFEVKAVEVVKTVIEYHVV